MSKQNANEELRNALLLCMRGMCGYCRMDAEARGMSTKCVNGCEALRVAKAALDRKPRNCDVGTPEEQVERFQWFCDTRPCDRCTLKNKGSAIHDCAIHWAQMPYEEGDEE